jgi:hypothetical protein
MDPRQLNDLLVDLADLLPGALRDGRLSKCHRQLAALAAAVAEVAPVLGDVVVDLELERLLELRARPTMPGGRRDDEHRPAREEDAGDEIETDSEDEGDDEDDDGSDPQRAA